MTLMTTPKSADRAIKTALQHHQAGRLQQAEALYRQVLQSEPNHPDALHLLGWIAHQAGQGKAAVELVSKAISVQPLNPVYYGDLGNMLHAQGEMDLAVGNYQKALSLDPLSVDVLFNLGNALLAQGKPAEAESHFRKVLTLKPDVPEAHNNLANALRAQGNLDAAVECYRKALLLKPDFAEVHRNLGHVLLALGKTENSIESFRTAVALRPDIAELHCSLGVALSDQGELYGSIDSFKRALDIAETPEARIGIAAGIRNVRFVLDNPDIRHLVIRAISEAWGRPADLASACISLIKCDLTVRECIERATIAWPARMSGQTLFGPSGFASVAQDQLLHALLVNAPACDMELERFLTMARFSMLEAAAGAGLSGAVDEAQLAFYCALARQCHINEYVFACTDEETEQASSLRGQLASALESASPFPVLWLVAVAAYFPLSGLLSAYTLLEKTWPEVVSSLLAQQVQEPRKEQGYRAAVPRLTGFDQPVSGHAQQQDEDNPYPRWVKLPPRGEPMTVDAYLRRHFPRASFEPLGKSDAVEILVAGCATGEYSIEVAEHFVGARVLAVDAGMANLAYAKRKTVERGLENIEYAQADIMKLATIGRSFDVIESAGALLDLADPLAGWREMLSLLRPGGFMRVVLHSECARRPVVAARNYIVEQGYVANDADIRRCRQDLLSPANSLRFGQVTASGDFFAMSGCRDLLFRTRENRYTLLQVKDILRDLGLDFIGFVLEPQVQRKYAERFPEDKSLSDLDCWNLFEMENPDSFAAMYRLFVQKRG